MKNKGKKLLAGLGIGLALTGATMLTGCTSDITFNQEDLDNAINNVNSYLTNKQNNDSEYVRNTLNELLINAMNDSVGVKNISYTSTSVRYDYGIKTAQAKYTYKRNVEDNVCKSYLKSEGNGIRNGTTYVELTTKSANDVISFELENYQIDDEGVKTYTKTAEPTEMENLMITADYDDYVGVYSSIIAGLNYTEEGIVWSDFVKSENNGVVTYKCTAINPEYMGYSMVGSMTLEFKDNKIIKMEMMSTAFKNRVNYDDDYTKNTIIFGYENENIVFDKTGFNIGE